MSRQEGRGICTVSRNILEDRVGETEGKVKRPVRSLTLKGPITQSPATNRRSDRIDPSAKHAGAGGESTEFSIRCLKQACPAEKGRGRTTKRRNGSSAKTAANISKQRKGIIRPHKNSNASDLASRYRNKKGLLGKSKWQLREKGKSIKPSSRESQTEEEGGKG